MLHNIILTTVLSLIVFGVVKSIEWIYNKCKLLHKKKENCPNYVTRVQVLTFAREHRANAEGLCALLRGALRYYGIYFYEAEEVFSLFTNKNARLFNAQSAHIDDYWWPPFEWNTGRLQFLDWLIDQYKDDPTDLTTLNL